VRKGITILLAMLIVIFYLSLKVVGLQKSAYKDRIRISNFEKLYKLDSLFWGRNFKVKDLRDYDGKFWRFSDSISYYCFIFISGGCSSCFESEIEIWNKLFLNLQSTKQVRAKLIAINVGLNDEKMLYYLKNNWILFPVLRDDGTYKKLFENFQDWEVIGFLVDQNLRIIKVHRSERFDIDKTINFVNKINQFLVDKQ
jgi:hypothetical protein